MNTNQRKLVAAMSMCAAVALPGLSFGASDRSRQWFNL